MKITKLKPIIITDKWHMDYYLYLYGFMKKEIFDELLKLFKERTDNEKYSALKRAIIDSEIRYVDGVFIGKTQGAKIAKELKEIGATFKYRKWMIDPALIPHDIKSAIVQAKMIMTALRRNLEKKFDKIQKNVSEFIKIADVDRIGNEALSKTAKAFNRTVRKELAVKPELDKLGKQKIKEDYLTTTELPIRKKLLHEFKDRSKAVLENFSQSTVERLRKDLEKMIIDGASRKDVQSHIMAKLQISKQRGKFIARQETALLTTKFKKAQYEQFGIDKYEWRCIHDHKVRPRHLELDGDIFEWSKPPIVTEKGEPKRWGHPGEDFRCFVGDTPVSSIGIPIRSYNRHYIGDIITLDTGFVRIKVTPNHPILTCDGWVPAQFINNTHKVFQRFTPNLINSSEQNINNWSISIQEIHDFFAVSFSSMRVDGADIQFHGDGRINEKVDVISMDSSLMEITDIIFPEKISQNIFSNSNSSFGFFQRLRTRNCLFDWDFSSSSSSMTGFGLIEPSYIIHTAPLKLFCGTVISDDNRIFFQRFFNGISRTIELFREDIDAITSFVKLDDLLDREIFFVDGCFMPFTFASINALGHEKYSGNVYNIETQSGAYVAGEIIVSNCRCQAVPVIEW